MSSSVLGRLVRQDKDLEVHGGVTAAELGEELDGAAQGQVGKSRQHQIASVMKGKYRHGTEPRAATNPQLRGGVRVSAPHGSLNGPHLVALVRAGARFDKGVMVERPNDVREVAA
jgi:hypothetical protein